MSIWDEIEDLLAVHDGTFNVEVASQCCWAGTLRLTLTDPPGAPSRSMVFLSVGNGSPQQCAKRLLVDVKKWIAEGAPTTHSHHPPEIIMGWPK